MALQRGFTSSGIKMTQDNRFSFTSARLASVPPPPSGATYVYDTATPGLAMRVTKTGARTFVLSRRIQGRPARITLGSFNAISIPDARRAAQRVSGEIASGVNVLAQRKAARARGRTVGDAF